MSLSIQDQIAIRDRFCAAAEKIGYAAEPSKTSTTNGYVSLASATLDTDRIYVICQLISIDGALHVNLFNINSRATECGAGRPALLSLFDMVDAAGIDEIRLKATQTGVYFHAAHFARCGGAEAKRIKGRLLDNLRDYEMQATGSPLSTPRRQQGTRVRQLLKQPPEQLGTLIEALREPVIGETEEGYPTLAKQLLLAGSGQFSYNAMWTKPERDMARARYNWKPAATFN